MQELATAFLDFLRDEIDLPGRYADPGLAPTATPARIPASMRRQVAKLLQGLRWDEATVGRFLGRSLSEPKPIVVFDPPSAPLSAAAFRKRIGAKGVHLDPRTQMLYDDASLHVNGTSHGLTASDVPLRHLADARALAAATCRTLDAGCVARLHEWYCDGYLAPGA